MHDAREEPKQEFHFPQLALCLQVGRNKGAPTSISVSTDQGEPLDLEVIGDWINATTADQLCLAHAKRHQARNRMNAIALGLQVLVQRLENGKCDNIDELLETVIGEFNAIECLLKPDGDST